MGYKAMNHCVCIFTSISIGKLHIKYSEQNILFLAFIFSFKNMLAGSTTQMNLSWTSNEVSAQKVVCL